MKGDSDCPVDIKTFQLVRDSNQGGGGGYKDKDYQEVGYVAAGGEVVVARVVGLQ